MPWVLIAVAGILARIAVGHTGVPDVLRPLLCTPYSDVERVREGVLLLATQPYASGSVHHPPLALAFWRAVWEAAQQADIPWQAATLAVATLSDAMLACLVYRICKLCLRQEARPQLEAWAARLPVPAVTAQLFARDRLPFTLATLCWLHPALITASAAMSTASFEALWPLAALLLAGLGRPGWAGAVLAAAAYFNPVTLALLPVLVPLAAQGVRCAPTAGGRDEVGRSPTPLVAVEIAAWFSVSAAFLLWRSVALDPSWSFAKACLSSAWLLPDLTPNVGLHWYFFTEVFARFKPYYLLVFAAHPFLYALPLAVRLSHRPWRAAHCMLGLMGLLRPYPTLLDGAVTTCCIMMHRTVYQRPLLTLLGAGCVGAAMAAMPVMWHLWLVAGSGNANFFFNATLVYNAGWVLLVLDFAAGAMRAELAAAGAANRAKAVHGAATAAVVEEPTRCS